VVSYLWVKALHIIAVISWMAGLLYLPRLFVNHAGRPVESEAAVMLAGMERRLLVFIMRPSALVTILTGGALLSTPGLVDWSAPWIHVKLASVLVLIAVHGACERWQRQFAIGANRHSARFFRMMNEVPTLAMLIIVAMVVLKP
jgi:protoporphyrinogen IX oxidase